MPIQKFYTKILYQIFKNLFSKLFDEPVNDQCQFCKHQHPKIKYEVNQNFNKIIKLKENSIKLSPKFDACKESVNKAKQFVDEIDLIAKDQDNSIYENFQQIRLKVHIRRVEITNI